MWFHVLATDFDGTAARDGTIAPATRAALGRARESGRRLLLVTGRELGDLHRVCPDVDLFDLIVAENGAVLYDPHAKITEDLVEPPTPVFLAALAAREIPIVVGRVIVATVIPYERPILEVIRELGLEMQIIFNREAVMVLPSGVSKESGLRKALRRLGMSRHNTIGVGDAENDHAFLAHVGCAVAVANAIPSLAAAADIVTRSPNGEGVREMIDECLLADTEPLPLRLRERAIELGATAEGKAITHPVLGPNVLITGTSGTGKSTLTGVFVERLVREDYVICLLDPEGDYRTMEEHEGIVVLTSDAGNAETRRTDVEQLLRHRSTSVTIDLSTLNREEKIRAGAELLHAVQRLRNETGSPHWIIIDEAHHLFPPGGSPAESMFNAGWAGVCLITNEPALVAPEVLNVVRHVFSTSISAVTETLPLLHRDQVPGGELEPGEALSISRQEDGTIVGVERFRVARRETSHKRHVRKYASGKLPPERWFHFRGPNHNLDLVAHNLEMFSMLVKGVDQETWMHHLKNGEVVSWLRIEIKDDELADEIAVLERSDDAQETRRIALEAIARRYTPTTNIDGRAGAANAAPTRKSPS